MKKITLIVLLAVSSSYSVVPQTSHTAPASRSSTFFFQYDILGDIVFSYSVPPSVMPTLPPGPAERPYYAEYSSYYINYLTSPWTYEPAGFLLAIYWGPY